MRGDVNPDLQCDVVQKQIRDIMKWEKKIRRVNLVSQWDYRLDVVVLNRLHAFITSFVSLCYRIIRSTAPPREKPEFCYDSLDIDDFSTHLSSDSITTSVALYSMRFAGTVVQLLAEVSYICAINCFYYGRNELKLSETFDYGLVNCPAGTKGCFFYQHRQCIGTRFGVVYSITGCLGNPDLCDSSVFSTRKLNGTGRCCYHFGCNLAMYNSLLTLPRWRPQHDFSDCDPCEQCGDTKISPSSKTAAPSTGYSTTATEALSATTKTTTTYSTATTTESTTSEGLMHADSL
ncbi:hypothetical protein RB195_020144 [Necator americanus]|uniref:Uncharacterized protein n=2 Tax=Necator americanus TaxID=51031 RepID=A0ABR1CHE7_NECAM